ncbi:endospore germination permease [Paenibacillus pasadenensis]|uniref:GerAB/ArcD/ProY family transporter n=1 Tax=Paenibacillus pasadenensis TaxID=217090 RepID=UPI00203FF945|nr:endospore germination permease [Paenibacillus pasadenensis]MCM3747771.1 endospore germination permease [Paenibacillus pasadenensis]
MPAAGKIHITMRQFKIILFFTVIGDSILILPHIMGNSAKEDAWISSLLALAGGILIGLLYSWMAERQAGQSLIGGSIALGGKWFGGFLGLIHVFFFYLVILTLVCEISLFMTSQMMVNTPSEAIVLVFLIAITTAMRYGVESFARLSELLYPVFLLVFLFLFVCLVPQIDFHYLLPFFGNGIFPIVKGTYPAFTFGFLESVGLLMLIPYVDQDRKAISKSIRNAFFMGGLLLFTVVVLCLLVLGSDMMEHKYYPTFQLAQQIEIGEFLERIEAALAFLWIVTVFFKTLLYSFSMMSGLREIFQLKDERIMAMPVTLLILAGSQISVPNVADYNYILSIFTNYDVVAYLLFPLVQSLLLGLPAVKKRLNGGGGSENSGSSSVAAATGSNQSAGSK